jgi:hypothetical protein
MRVDDPMLSTVATRRRSLNLSEFAEFVDAGKQGVELIAQLRISELLKKSRILVADHGDAGGRRNEDGLSVLIETDEALGLGKRLGTETGVGMHLAAAGLLGLEMD